MNVQFLQPQPETLSDSYVVIVNGQGIAYHGNDRHDALTACFYHALIAENVELRVRKAKEAKP